MQVTTAQHLIKNRSFFEMDVSKTFFEPKVALYEYYQYLGFCFCIDYLLQTLQDITAITVTIDKINLIAVYLNSNSN